MPSSRPISRPPMARTERLLNFWETVLVGTAKLGWVDWSIRKPVYVGWPVASFAPMLTASSNDLSKATLRLADSTAVGALTTTWRTPGCPDVSDGPATWIMLRSTYSGWSVWDRRAAPI